METATALDTPLGQLHQRAGAKLGSWFGCVLPNEFSDWPREYSFARNTVALIDKNYRAYISFAGPDRVRYLNAILSNNIKDLVAGHAVVALLLNAQGHILAEIETHARADQLFCVSYAMIRESLIQNLDKYIIMDDVTLTDDTHRFGTLALEGPAAADLVKQITNTELNSLPELGSVEVLVSGISCTVVKRTPGAQAGAEFLTERQHLEPLWKILDEKATSHGGGAMGYTALSALRLEQGAPWFSYDFGEKQIPHEANLQNTHLSFTKGCYPGQEIVERVRSRGQVNRQRVGLVFSGTEVPVAGEPLTAGGAQMGYVTRAALSPTLGLAIGMGYLRREHSAEGSQLDWRLGTATVAKFPTAR